MEKAIEYKLEIEYNHKQGVNGLYRAAIRDGNFYIAKSPTCGGIKEALVLLTEEIRKKEIELNAVRDNITIFKNQLLRSAKKELEDSFCVETTVTAIGCNVNFNSDGD